MALETQTAEVRIRTNWSDDWGEPIQYLYADRTEFVAGPKVASAEIVFRYGPIMRPDRATFLNFVGKDLIGRFVWIKQENGTVDNVAVFRNWYGFVAQEIDKQDGDELQDFDGTGNQRFTCLGMGALLERIFITQSEVFLDDTNKTVERAIGFNTGSRGEFQGNRSTTDASSGNPLFAGQLTESASTTWSTLAILQYMLHFFGPVDSSNNQAIVYNITGQTAELASVAPQIDPDRRSVKRILDTLIDRRRLYGYAVEVDGDTNEVNIRVFTFSEDDIDLPSGALVPANAVQGNLNNELRDTSVVTNLEIARSDAHRYERVIARGEPATVTFSLSNSFSYDNLEEDWSASHETQYETGASGIGSAYTNADQAVKIALNAAARKKEELRRVWRYFRVPPAWDFVDVNGSDKIFATDDQDKNVWFPGLRFADNLVLLTDHDYSPAPVNGLIPVVDNTPTGSHAELVKPFVVIRRNQSDPFQWEFIDKMGGGYGETANRDEEMQTGGIDFSGSVRMQDGSLGIVVNITGNGTAQHTIARDDFTPTDAADTAGPKALLKWETMMATVTMELDWSAEGVHPAPGGFVPLEKTLVLTIAGKRADWLAAETMLDLNADATQARSSSTAGYITDDRDDLRDAARTAFEWYSETRNAIRATIHRGDHQRSIGDFINSLVDDTDPLDDINTVITTLSFDLLQGTATIITQSADIDFGGI